MNRLNITIRNVENLGQLVDYGTVTGEWIIHEADCPSVFDVAESVRNYLDYDFHVDVFVFHSDGRGINGDCPSEGTFVAVRS